MDDSRLQHLRRQQALLREHLAWIDAEIARATAENQQPVEAGEPVSQATSIPPPSADTISDNAADPDELLARYAGEERQNPKDVRRGCLILFFGILISLAIALALVWVLRYR